MTTRSTSAKPKRRQGGQPGNANALKHGYYAKDLSTMNVTDYDERIMRNMLGEAAMIKDFMYHLYNTPIDKTDFTAISNALRGLSLGAVALARLLFVHSRIRILPSSNTSGILNKYLADMDAMFNSPEEEPEPERPWLDQPPTKASWAR